MEPLPSSAVVVKPSAQLQLTSTLEELSLFHCEIDVLEPGRRLEEAFDGNPLLPGAVLKDEGGFAGIISRSIFLKQLSRPFGQEVFLNRPIHSMHRFIRTDVLVFNASARIAAVADAAVKRAGDLLYEPVVVETADGRRGLLDVPQLLLARSKIHDHTTRLLEKANSDLASTAKELRETQAQLIRSAHHAGMSEIAEDVLHNIGNAVNSLNTSIFMLFGDLKKFRLDFFEKLVHLVEEHENDFSPFFSAEQRAEHFIKALGAVHGNIKHQHSEIMREASDFRKQVEIINDIVKSQDSYIRSSRDFVEEVDLRTLLEEAVKIQASIFARFQISVHYDFEFLPKLILSKSKLGQVFHHLIKNACESMAEDNKARHLRIRTPKPKEKWVQIEITDSGCGIAEENLIRVFSSCFSTKHEGTGLGLHYCANTINELNGKIRAHSRGLGRGSTFEVQLPVMPFEGACI